MSLAKRLAAHQVVFATESEEWHPSILERIRKVFTDERFALILLTYKHLYSARASR
jgi:hypothetical protein